MVASCIPGPSNAAKGADLTPETLDEASDWHNTILQVAADTIANAHPPAQHSPSWLKSQNAPICSSAAWTQWNKLISLEDMPVWNYDPLTLITKVDTSDTTTLARYCAGPPSTFSASSFAWVPDESFQQRGVGKVKIVRFLNLAQLASFEQLGRVRKLFCQGRAERRVSWPKLSTLTCLILHTCTNHTLHRGSPWGEGANQNKNSKKSCHPALQHHAPPQEIHGKILANMAVKSLLTSSQKYQQRNQYISKIQIILGHVSWLYQLAGIIQLRGKEPLSELKRNPPWV